MLQQILKDMYIDPEVLDALNEDQKKTLFLKMRQEQVRRWTEREEKQEREAGDASECKRTKPKKANSKNVSWLPGRDGDVAVIVIGELDELSSKFICSGLGEKKEPSLQHNAYLQTILKSRKTSEVVRTERENLPPNTQPGISLNLKGKCEETTSTLLPLPVSLSEHPSPPATKKQPEPKSASVASEEKSLSQPSICSRPPMRANPVNVRPASANAAPPGSVNTRPGLANLRLQADSTATPSPSPLPRTIRLDYAETSTAKVGKDIGAPVSSSASLPTCSGRGRVAQLLKTFSTESSPQIPPRGIKPPLPTKPGHLRVTATPTIR